MKEPPLSYGSYLKINELISLQQLRSVPAAHDEMLFIVVHQVYELWFKLCLFEIRQLVKDMDADDTIACYRALQRLNEVFRVLVHQIDILETMTASEFNEFRDVLKPASGFQSKQFRELELLCGGSLADYGSSMQFGDWKNDLTAVSKERNLRTAFFELLKRSGITPNDLLKIYSDSKYLSLYNLCEQVLSFDEGIQLWRFRHVQMVERMIGQKPGTGGSLGVQYLQTTVARKFFPELWNVRTQMEKSSY